MIPSLDYLEGTGQSSAMSESKEEPSGVFLFLCSCVPVFVCSCVPVFLCSCVPVFLCSCVPVFLCSCVPVFLCTNFTELWFYTMKRFSVLSHEFACMFVRTGTTTTSSSNNTNSSPPGELLHARLTFPPGRLIRLLCGGASCMFVTHKIANLCCTSIRGSETQH
jgi:hypothetical protein